MCCRCGLLVFYPQPDLPLKMGPARFRNLASSFLLCLPERKSTTLQWVRDLLGAKQGFASVVIARDMGVLLDLFDEAECFEMGENGLNGLNMLIPQVGLRKLNDNKTRLQLRIYPMLLPDAFGSF